MGQALALFRRALLGTAFGLAAAGGTPAGNKLPRVVHRRLNRRQLRPGRLIVVGDVHGCYDELRSLLDKVELTANDNLLLVGDLVNKGPKSLQVCQYVRQCGLSVRGNHDDAALASRRLRLQPAAAATPTAAAAATAAAAPKPGRAWVSELEDADAAFLEQLPFSLTLPDYGVCIVHAGRVPGLPLTQQGLADLYKMRDVRPVAGGGWEALEAPQEGSQAWASCWQGPLHVFFGHDAKRRLQLEEYATGLDTGCVYGGRLTAAVLPPLTELGGRPAFQAARRAGRPPTLNELGAQLVGVDALRTYEAPKLGPGKGGSTGGMAV